MLPHIDVFLDDGYTKEEWKVIVETRKILHLPDLPVSCTAVRVPVITSHSEAVHVELTGSMTPDEARELFAAVPGVIVRDDPANDVYPLPTEGAGRDEVFVGRIRADASLPRGQGPGLLGGLRQPAQGCRHQRRRDRRGGPAQRLAAPASRACRRSRVTTEEREGRTRSHRQPRSASATAVVWPETRTQAVPGEGSPDTEVVFVGEGPGQNEDRQGRPFVGAAGSLLEELLGMIGWSRDDVFITNVVKCRPPNNRDPEPDEMAACEPFLRRQLEVLDPALVVTLGRFSLQTFMPGDRISRVHGTERAIDPATGARAAVRLRHVPPGRSPAPGRAQGDHAARHGRYARGAHPRPRHAPPTDRGGAGSHSTSPPDRHRGRPARG